MSLTKAEQEFMEIFRHFKAVEGHTLLPQNITAVSSRYLSPPNQKKIQEIAQSLANKGFITENLALTKTGEEFLYPDSNQRIDDSGLSTGEKEFMEIYKHFKAVEGHTLLPQNITAVSSQYLSPPNQKKIQEIAQSLANKGFITENLALTKTGEDYLY